MTLKQYISKNCIINDIYEVELIQSNIISKLKDIQKEYLIYSIGDYYNNLELIQKTLIRSFQGCLKENSETPSIEMCKDILISPNDDKHNKILNTIFKTQKVNTSIISAIVNMDQNILEVLYAVSPQIFSDRRDAETLGFNLLTPSNVTEFALSYTYYYPIQLREPFRCPSYYFNAYDFPKESINEINIIHEIQNAKALNQLVCADTHYAILQCSVCGRLYKVINSSPIDLKDCELYAPDDILPILKQLPDCNHEMESLLIPYLNSTQPSLYKILAETDFNNMQQEDIIETYYSKILPIILLERSITPPIAKSSVNKLCRHILTNFNYALSEDTITTLNNKYKYFTN